MSLRRRITGAAAVAVAAVAITLGVAGYLGTRSQLFSDLHRQLQARAAPYLQPHRGRSGHNGALGGGASGRPPGRPDGGPIARAGPAFRGRGDLGAPGGFGGFGPSGVPPAPALGGAPGYFQFVYPGGTAAAGDGGDPELPVDARVRAIARSATGSFFRAAYVRGVHVEVLTIGDRYDGKAVEVALPLASVDSVLHGLLLTYGILIAAGIFLAGLLGAAIARSALAPIDRFSERTERVISALHRPRRLEESGAPELRRLAHSFNETLDALERSIQAQRHLIADASHELRTPLAALRSNIQIFLDAHRLPPTDRAELRDAILAELDELTQLVTDVLDLARGASPGEHAEPLELDGLVRDTVARARRRAPGLKIEERLAPTVIVASPDRVARALTNVIDNARKWSPSGGRIEVSLHGGLLTVRDHGPGFREEDLPHVFDRFYRAQEARRMPGSGLGLAIVKQAAEARGGSVSAANAPDGGAIVRVRFSAPTDTAAAPGSTPIGSNLRAR